MYSNFHKFSLKSKASFIEFLIIIGFFVMYGFYLFSILSAIYLKQ